MNNEQSPITYHLSTITYHLSPVNCQLSTANCQTVIGQRSTVNVNCQLSTVSSQIKPILQSPDKLRSCSKKTVFSSQHPAPVDLELGPDNKVPHLLGPFV